ncbi:MAG: AraC family transcriptional regulator [Planctomycetota bacterium]
MDAVTWYQQRDLTTWSVAGHLFQERHLPRTRWWFNNMGRQPAGRVVVQYIRSGQAVLREADNERTLGPGSLFLFAYDEDSAYGRPPERTDWPGHDELLVTDHLTLIGAGLRAHWNLFRARHGSVISLSQRDPFLALMRETVVPGRRSMLERVATLVGALAEVVEHAASATRSPVAHAIDAILANPCSDHNLKAIAQRCGCSREHLSRLFQEQIGSSPAVWMRQRRIERALTLLRDTDLSLSAVAERCGAGTLHRLARWAREVHGQPPLKLRKRLRAEAERPKL